MHLSPDTKVQSPTPKMWHATRTLAQKLSSAVSSETSLVKARKKQKNDLDELGRDERTVVGKAWQKAAADLKLTEMALKDARDSKIFYADKLQECVALASNGQEYSLTDLEAIDTGKNIAEAPLFAAAMKNAALPPEPSVPVGEPAPKPAVEPDAGKKKTKDLPAPAAEAPWLAQKIVETRVGLTVADCDALKEVGLNTVGEAYTFIHQEHGKLQTVDGLSPKGGKALADLIGHYLTAKPAVEVVGEPEAKLNGKPVGAGITPKKVDPSGKKKK